MTRPGREDDRRRGMNLHPGIGRRYEHADLTAHRHKTRKRRRMTLLVQRALRTMVDHYVQELEADPALFDDFAHEVGRRLRLEIQPEWTLEEAERHAIALAEALFEELDESVEGSPEEDSGAKPEKERPEGPPGAPGGSPGEA